MTDIKYGHTDSLYVGVDSPEHAMEIVEVLNEKVRKYFPNVFDLEEHPVTLEFEKFFRTLGVGSVKNRNAGMISWVDGNYLDEEKFVMTGFTAKRMSETPLSKDVQLTVLKMWVNEKSEEEIVAFLKDKYNEVITGEIPLEQLVKRTRYREERFTVFCSNCKKNGWKNKYDLHDLMKAPCCNNPTYRTSQDKKATIGAGVEGVLFHNRLNPENPITDSYYFLRISGCHDTYTHPLTQWPTVPNYISFRNLEELIGFRPDYYHYAMSVANKAEPIFTAMGWDISQVTKDERQRGLDEWF